MALIIDGYNLLHVTGIVGKGTASFQGSREALLNFLAASMAPRERDHATVVFDAADAPPGLPRIVQHQGMTVRYASEYPDADTLIEKLVAQHSAPRSLLVVSSDHRVQRAARRRRARFVDSDTWYGELVRKRIQSQRHRSVPAEKPIVNLTAAEVEYWIAQFAMEDSPQPPPAPQDSDAPLDLNNPFPPGYGEDLLDDDQVDG